MTTSDGFRPLLDEEAKRLTDRLMERSASVLEEFATQAETRRAAVEDLLSATEQLATENGEVLEQNDSLRRSVENARAEYEALRGELEAVKADLGTARSENDRLRANMKDFFAEAGELAAHHRRVLGVLGEVTEAISARVSSDRDDDRRIDAARAMAFSRARFGIGDAREDDAHEGAERVSVGGHGGEALMNLLRGSRP